MDPLPLFTRTFSHESESSCDSLDTVSLDSDLLAAYVSSGEWARGSPTDGRAADGSALNINDVCKEVVSRYEEAEAEEKQATREVMDMVTVAPNVVLAKKADASRPLPRAVPVMRGAHSATQTAVATGVEGEGETRAMHIVRRRPQRLVTQTDLARELLRINDSDVMIRLCRNLRRDQSTRRLCEAVGGHFGPELLAEAVRALKGTQMERMAKRVAKLGTHGAGPLSPPTPTIVAVAAKKQPPAAFELNSPTAATLAAETKPTGMHDAIQSALDVDDGDWGWMLG
jgi:hypothetical protein